MARTRSSLRIDDRLAATFADVALDRTAPIAPQISAYLRDKIVHVELQPGDPLPESRLAELFGVSRTPLREAMRRLVQEDLITVAAQSGTFVAPLRVARVEVGAFLRMTLECANIKDAAEKADAAFLRQVRRLVAAQHEAAEHGEVRRFHALDDRMHAAFLTVTGRAEVWRVIQAAKAHIDRARIMTLSAQGIAEQAVAQHTAILDAVERRDGEGAEEAMRIHLSTIKVLIRQLRDGQTDLASVQAVEEMAD